MPESNQLPSNLSFEQALKELEALVRKLESGQVDLDAAIADYGRGVALKDYCQKKLSDAKMKVEKIIAQSNGTLATAPLDTAS